jgi:hypothetical protein
MKIELKDLMLKYGSDKFGSHHNYTVLYESEFKDIKDEVKNFLEVGLGTNNPNIPSSMGVDGKPGASLRAWRDYFVNANIYGLDIDKDILFEEDRIKTFYCDQTSKNDIDNFLNSENIKNLEFDIIIDDGLHNYDANYFFLINSFHKLKAGGIYVVEDLIYQDAINFKNNKQKLKDILKFSDFNIYELKHQNTYDNRLLVIKK